MVSPTNMWGGASLDGVVREMSEDVSIERNLAKDCSWLAWPPSAISSRERQSKHPRPGREDRESQTRKRGDLKIVDGPSEARTAEEGRAPAAKANGGAEGTKLETQGWPMEKRGGKGR